MRLISQDSKRGTVDLPYEQVVINWYKKKQVYQISAYPPSDFEEGHYFVLAEYATKKQISMALKLMYHAYNRRNKYFQFPSDNEMKLKSNIT